jgi:hypothetical protein
LYADGSVAAFEELVGSHGGLGGQQTDAFVFHPAEAEFTATANSVEVYSQLNARRGRQASPPIDEADAPAHAGWSPTVLASGLVDLRKWIGLLGRALLLDRQAYRVIADEASLNGPALLVALAGSALLATFGGFDPPDTNLPWLARMPLDFGGWLAGVAVAYVGGLVLRANGTFSSLFRTLAFARVVRVITPLRVLLPALGPVLVLLEGLWVIAAVWLAVSEGLRVRGWRVLATPLIGLVVVLLSLWAVELMAGGLILSVESVLADLGLMPQ